MTLAEKIQDQRERLGISQAQFAERLGVSRELVEKWEAGKTAPDVEQIAQISELFGVSTDFLLNPNLVDGTVPSTPTMQPVVRQKRRISKGVLLGILGTLLILITAGTVLSLYNNHVIFFSADSKMEYYFNNCPNNADAAATLFNEKFAGTDQEETALAYLENSLSRYSLLDVAVQQDEWSSLLSTLNTKNEKISSLLDGFETLKLETPITDLNANPDEYCEKEILILGGVQSNDLRRKAVRLVTGDYNIECSYVGEDWVKTGIDWDSYHTTTAYTAYGQEPAAAFGYVKRYSDSDDVYLLLYQYCDPSSMEQTTCEAIRSIAEWDITAANEQEARPMLKNTVPSYYPSDILPLYRVYNVLNSNESEEDVVLSYLSNGDFEDVIAYYHDLMIKIDGKYIQQNLSNQMRGMTVLLPGTDNCVYVLVSDGAVVDGAKVKKATIAIVIASDKAYYETVGTVVS